MNKQKPYSEYQQDRAAFRKWIQAENGDNADEHNNLRTLLARALREELTERQMTYISAYYAERLTMSEIAERYGVSKSSVCRTIARAENRLKKVCKYANATVLRQALGCSINMEGVHAAAISQNRRRRNKAKCANRNMDDVDANL